MKRVSLFLPDDLIKGLERLKDQHGTPHAESIRRAIAAYLKEMGAAATAQKGGSKRNTSQK